MIPARRVLVAPRVRLAPLGHAHDESLRSAISASRNELEPWMPWAREDGQRAFTDFALRAWASGREYHFTLLVDGEPAGVLGLRNEGNDEYEIGYWIASARAGHGYTTEAAAALLDFAFDQLGARAVILNAGRENRRSLRIAAKLGFEPTGPIPGGMEGTEGNFPALSHRLERPAWGVRREQLAAAAARA